jgi:Mlc titration factor MtfA (ptsG expression regulator)
MQRRPYRDHNPDPTWEAIAAGRVARWSHLDDAGRLRLLDQARELDRTRFWEGLDGLVVTQEMRAEIASTACILTVNIGLRALADVTSILIEPTASSRVARHAVGGSMITESHSCVLGEALLHGPVRLAWDQVSADASGATGASVVIHEFAHKIDMADGAANGTPPLERRKSLEFDRISDETLDGLRAGTVGDALRPYAATNRAELFAVASEAFFLNPHALHAQFGPLYEMLADVYRQHPLG